MTYYVCVARETLRANNNTGRDDPVWVIYTDIEGRGKYYLARRIKFQGEATAIQDRLHPLPNGATAWIETDGPIATD